MKTIREIVESHLTMNDLSRKDFVSLMGYKNIPKGLRRLDICVQTGHCPEAFKKMLANQLQVTQAEIAQAIYLLQQDVQRKKLEVEKDRFRPHIKISHAGSRPSNITAVALLGVEQFKKIELDEGLSKKSIWEQIESVKEVIKRHFEQANGICPLFGAITGYRYFYQFDEWVTFSIEGDILKYESGVIPDPEAFLKI